MGDLILIGLPASGKTTVGRQLARRLDMPFFDCDEAIEAAAGCSVSDIFARYGESYFRQLEHRTLEALCRKESCVIATGGGAVLRQIPPQAKRVFDAAGIFRIIPLEEGGSSDEGKTE